MSQIEVTRHFCLTTPVQHYFKHMLKNFKFSVYLISVLMLWVGFYSVANSAQLYKLTISNYWPSSTYQYPTLDACGAAACTAFDAYFASAEFKWFCTGYTITAGQFAGYVQTEYEPFYKTSQVAWQCVESIDTSTCNSENPFNPSNNTCDPNYTPPPPPPPLIPPEKNFGNECIGGSNSSGPSALVGK